MKTENIKQLTIIKDYIQKYGMENLLFTIKYIIADIVNDDVNSGRGIDEYLYRLYDDIELAQTNYQKRNEKENST